MKAIRTTCIGALSAALAACGGGSGDGDGMPGPMATPLTVDIVAQTSVPLDGANFEGTLSRTLDDPDGVRAELVELPLEAGGPLVAIPGLTDYRATEKKIVFSPFNLLKSDREYRFSLSADGTEVESTFRSATGLAELAPDVTAKTYEFRIANIIHPEELAPVVNGLISNEAPPVMMQVLRAVEDDLAGRPRISVEAVSTTGIGDTLGEAVFIDENEDHPTTTSVLLPAEILGRWFGAGPYDLHTTASGVQITIEDMFITGVIGANGESIENVRISGVINPVTLAEGLAQNEDAQSFKEVCDNRKIARYCDDQGRIQVAAEIDAAENTEAQPFLPFITHPINASKDVPTDTKVEVYFSRAADENLTTIQMTDDDGNEVSGAVTWAMGRASFQPDQPLNTATRYCIAVQAHEMAGDAVDTRHLRFSTPGFDASAAGHSTCGL